MNYPDVQFVFAQRNTATAQNISVTWKDDAHMNHPKRCPIPGCNLHYASGITGWVRHVGSLDTHPFWHATERDSVKRRHLFVAEFPQFFEGTRSRSNPPPPDSRPVSRRREARSTAVVGSIGDLTPGLDHAIRAAIHDAFVAAFGPGAVPPLENIGQGPVKR